MSYQQALEATGVKVLAFEETGDYQGTWFALTDNKEFPIVIGDYGSCSGCDAFEAEFGYSYSDDPSFESRLKTFGQSYLNDGMTWQEFEAQVERQRYDKAEWQNVLKVFKSVRT